jgi:tetratricopeptide (TPR) repeat protein
MGRGVAILVALVAGCGGSTDREPEPVRAEPERLPVAAPVLPAAAGPLGPARVTAPAGPATAGTHLADAETCADCHEAAAAQWASSAHAFSSFSNPIYRLAVDNLRAERDHPTSRFCGGCHDLALLVDGAMDRPVRADDVRAHAGITCRACHGVTRVDIDGNGSYELRAEPIPLPKANDQASVDRHKKAASRDDFGADLCTGCHRSFLGPDTGNPHHLPGQDEPTVWKSSPYGGNGLARVDHGVSKRDCIGCHMTREKIDRDDPAADGSGRLASHRFIGGHTWLAAMRGDDADLARRQEFLRAVASIDVAAAETPRGQTLGADGAPIAGGDELLLDVVVRNLKVGHKLPAGVLDAGDVWIEIEVRDARGELIAAGGRDHRTRDGDASAHVLRVLLADDAGSIVLDRRTHEFRGKVVDHTAGPRDSIATRYRMVLPETLALPLEVDARLLHRTRNLALQKLACDASRTADGRAFAAGSRQYRGAALDPCAPQPITEIARDRARLGAGAEPVADDRPRWRRLYEHGAALAHSVQEDLDRARAPLAEALAELDRTGTDGWARAAVLAALGGVSGRQGRTAEALALLDRAEAEAPGHPALARLRGTALAQVWRWADAVPPLRAAADGAPGNLGAWVDLSVALGSLGRDREALAAAQKGLALSPRNAALLRVQALSLKALGQPFDDALAAYDRHRPPDIAPHLRVDCAALSADCARERNPVHIHDLIAR